ncbi:MAG TPA: peptidoglycan bridge formation glycyltransferase FemA/FemB family protein [Candidatus Peribacteraceae bacterium]|nr:peptidoglycan bridge formation glycyltransferase FemA/FemB family protein [Candidatus Peribacteraceae bacterium]
MQIHKASSQRQWDDFLKAQRFSPFLQSWTMGDVYADIGQTPIRLEIRESDELLGVCLAVVVPARRGRHLTVHYGPVLKDGVASPVLSLELLMDALRDAAIEHNCTFLRLSPFWPISQSHAADLHAVRSPLHLLAEHVWYVPLTQTDRWSETQDASLAPQARTEEEIFMSLRKTTRNLIRRAEKEGVTIELSQDPLKDIEEFIRLHDETRKRHGFTPYTNSYFRSQVKHFAPTGNALLYLARYQGQVISASIHMQFGGETSYHHGASTHAFSKIPSSYLLQWRAIQDALKRGDHVYNLWGIAPMRTAEDGKDIIDNPKHPFAGVTLFKTGFGGKLLNLEHCFDIPISKTYYLTRAFEQVRKWKRGF